MEIFKFHRFVAASESDDVRGNGFVPSNRRTQLLFYRAERNRSSRKHVLFLPSNHQSLRKRESLENLLVAKTGESRFFFVPRIFSTIFIQIFLPRLLHIFIQSIFFEWQREREREIRSFFFNIICPLFSNESLKKKKKKKRKFTRLRLLFLLSFSSRHRSLIYSSASGSIVELYFLPYSRELNSEPRTPVHACIESFYLGRHDRTIARHVFFGVRFFSRVHRAVDEWNEYKFRIALTLNVDIYRWMNVRVFIFLRIHCLPLIIISSNRINTVHSFKILPLKSRQRLVKASLSHELDSHLL